MGSDNHGEWFFETDNLFSFIQFLQSLNNSQRAIIALVEKKPELKGVTFYKKPENNTSLPVSINELGLTRYHTQRTQYRYA